MAISQIMQNLNNVYCYIAYPTGYALGTFLGILIDEKLAIGKVVVRVITRKPATDLIDVLQQKSYRYTTIQAEGNEGEVTVLFTVVDRKYLATFLSLIKQFHSESSYTVEGVKKVSEIEQPFARHRLKLPFWYLDDKRK